MKTVDETIKAIKYRMNQLEIFNEQILEISQNGKEESKSLKHIFFENEARLNELSTLLEYITNPELGRNETENIIRRSSNP